MSDVRVERLIQECDRRGEPTMPPPILRRFLAARGQPPREVDRGGQQPEVGVDAVVPRTRARRPS
jgi:hypothetical protein